MFIYIQLIEYHKTKKSIYTISMHNLHVISKITVINIKKYEIVDDIISIIKKSSLFRIFSGFINSLRI
jgi:hypothetical protein